VIRVGQGFDLHRLEAGRPFILGGVTIPHETGMAGHSDADVLVHAVIDALLGAAAQGDIGSHFPDTDPGYKGADSLELLSRTGELIAAAGWAIGNIDATVVAERPKLRPHIEAIRERMAETLGIAPGAVSVKAKTHERVGPEGRGEAVSAQAVCLLYAENGGGSPGATA
jgi:2-C-methyl-D-erythritol 2,4-cyclodiphosphate synthase